MVKILMGLRGAGKTKQMVDMISQAVRTEKGAVIAIARGRKLDSEINARECRLIDAKEFDVRSYQVLRGFITGLYAGNYDITHIFIDSLFKVVACEDMGEFERFLDWLGRFGGEHGIEFTLSVSCDAALASEKVKGFLI